MAAHKRDSDFSPASELEIGIKRAAPELWRLMRGMDKRYGLTGWGVRYLGPGRYVARVKACDNEAVYPVVAYGTGSSDVDALRKVSASIRRGAWQADKYPGSHWAV